MDIQEGDSTILRREDDGMEGGMPFQGDLGLLEEGVAVLVLRMEWAEIQRMKTLDLRGT